MLSVVFSAFKRKRSLQEKVLKIQAGDLHLRNELIDSFKPFIAKTVSSVCKRYMSESDDEFSIGLIAFNEAIDKYSPEKGRSLLAFAETLIKRSVIDYIRSESRRRDLAFDMYSNDENQDHSQLSLDAEKSLQEYMELRESEKRKEEIEMFNRKLQEFDVTFQDLVKNSPKHIDARKSAIDIAKTLVADQDLNNQLFATKRLPIKQLEQKVSVSRKTIERNRKYIIAISIIINGDFLYLKDYIKGELSE
jgi:RNA polymerase sigma factor